eukprot:12423483-Alexandrium_andersonii.AAC.1
MPQEANGRRPWPLWPIQACPGNSKARHHLPAQARRMHRRALPRAKPTREPLSATGANKMQGQSRFHRLHAGPPEMMPANE